MKQVLRLAWQEMRVMATLGLVKFVRVKKLLKPVSHVLSCFEISLLTKNVISGFPLFFAEPFS